MCAYLVLSNLQSASLSHMLYPQEPIKKDGFFSGIDSLGRIGHLQRFMYQTHHVGSSI